MSGGGRSRLLVIRWAWWEEPQGPPERENGGGEAQREV